MKYVIETEKAVKNCAECPCLRLGEWDAFEKSSCGLSQEVIISRSKRPKECPMVKADKKQAGVIYDYFGRRYVADNVTLKTIDGKGVCSFYGFKEMKEDER